MGNVPRRTLLNFVADLDKGVGDPGIFIYGEYWALTEVCELKCHQTTWYFLLICNFNETE